ncbi:phage holin [Lachnoclostridium sp. Marseille-P6806]|uniref:phage holin n=1 Tax=Lachnoclostridium sp. Marseille-P6806 TaxID=2364793 RepID=UPI001031DD41|nr:phage holin [Lachnoclostridium sp. Marseille-P6806]
MNEILFEALKLVMMVCGLVIVRYLIPWMKSRIGAENLTQAGAYVRMAVYAIQQTMWSDSGEKRKDAVIQLVSKWCAEHRITITMEQIDTLIEAAVKQMKMEEGRADEHK